MQFHRMEVHHLHVNISQNSITHRIHGTGIFTYIWLIFYGKCRYIVVNIPYMDGMGNRVVTTYEYQHEYEKIKLKNPHRSFCLGCNGCMKPGNSSHFGPQNLLKVNRTINVTLPETCRSATVTQPESGRLSRRFVRCISCSAFLIPAA